MHSTKESIRLINPMEINKKTYTFYGVDCVILITDNKILLQKRGDDCYHFPGYLFSFDGQMEEGETPKMKVSKEL